MTDHTATLDRNDPDQDTQANATWFVQLEACCIVWGGLRYPSAEALDAEVRWWLTRAPALDVSRADATRLAAALIHGYVTTHPVADAAELDYVADLRALRRLQASRRRLQRAVWAARGLHARARAASHALVAFAHPVHNPVENSTGVVL